jgi:DNA invertase Pin-like site-specific DNA recombinase
MSRSQKAKTSTVDAPPASPLTCVFYARVQADEPRQTPITIDWQLRTCQRYAARQRWKVLGRFTDPNTPVRDLKRPGLQALRGRMKSKPHVDIVLVWSFDRIADLAEDFSHLRDTLSSQGTRLVSLAGSMPADEWLAQEEGREAA